MRWLTGNQALGGRMIHTRDFLGWKS